jgi:hypothetical protein
MSATQVLCVKRSYYPRERPPDVLAIWRIATKPSVNICRGQRTLIIQVTQEQLESHGLNPLTLPIRWNAIVTRIHCFGDNYIIYHLDLVFSTAGEEFLSSEFHVLLIVPFEWCTISWWEWISWKLGFTASL